VIHGQPPRSKTCEGWGGIAYALSGFDAALTDGLEIVPIIKVGADLSTRATELLSTLRHRASDARLITVAEPNNRSELRYYSEERRSEFLRGGVPGWSWHELQTVLDSARLDALYVNFLSGWELSLPIARQLRQHFAGPIYADLHMLTWTVLPSGMRALRTLDDPPAWCECFDFIQVNEDEMGTLAHDAESLGAMALSQGADCVVVTLGQRGVAYFTPADFCRLADLGRVSRNGSRQAGIVPPDLVREGPDVDPTGCGDVWGATFFAKLLAGLDLAEAMRSANRAAGRNAEYQGVNGLIDYLRVDDF
jgi:hypothetical protein